VSKKTRTADQYLVREINLSIVLNALRDHAPVSRARLAVLTSLNKTTVSSLVDQLIDAQFVSELGPGKPGYVGRPGILLTLNPDVGWIIGVDLGVDYISLIMTNFATDIVWRSYERTGGDGQDAIIPRMIEMVRGAVGRAQGEGRSILGIGVGLPGLVDTATGKLLFAPNLGWRDLPMRKILAEHFGFPIYVENEANIAAFGESYMGAARGAGNVIYVLAGVGIGGGVVVDGHMLPGASGLAGEIGHVTMDPEGRLCNCGNRGCWETLADQAALFRRVKEASASGRESVLSQYLVGDAGSLTVPIVAEAARNGDEVALKALEETAIYLGIGMAGLINIFNPDGLVFGGTLSVAHEFLMPIIERVMHERALRWSLESSKIVIAAHGQDAAAMGGVALVYQQVLAQPTKSMRKEPDRRSEAMPYPGYSPIEPWSRS
jgi:glucokinase-like ROK family protein